MTATGEFDETRRKLVHVSMLLFALPLRWLPWWGAALGALAALGYNAFLYRRLHGASTFRPGEEQASYSRGILLYPLAVLGLILVFRHELAIAGAAWAVLALGDGFATLVGKRVRGRRLPWSESKTWAGSAAFVIAGAAGALAAGIWLHERFGIGHEPSLGRLALASLAAALLAAIVESVETGIDDNLSVPAAAAFAFWLIVSVPLEADRVTLGLRFVDGLLLSALVGALAFAARAVDVRGFIAGLAIGTPIWAAGGPYTYVALLAFFVVGVGATKVGYREKKKEGLAEARGGRRSVASVVAKGVVPASWALAYALGAAHGGQFLFLGALATAAADTVSSEIGKRYGKRAFSPLTLARKERGSEGAISVEGTVAGWLAAALVAASPFLLALALAPATAAGAGRAALAVVAAAAIANHLESIAGHVLRIEGERANEVLNFAVCLAGGLLALALAPSAPAL